jgi:glycine cleavage system H protein
MIMSKTYFTDEHEWIRVEGSTATVGITKYAQEQLGDLVFVELPKPGQALTKGGACVVVESVKAASDVYAPADGAVTDVNAAVASDPQLVTAGSGK